MDRRPGMPDAGAPRSAALRLADRGERAVAASARFGTGPVVLSLLLHAAAAAAVAAASAWRAAPPAPSAEPALQVVWVDARPLSAPADVDPPVPLPEPPHDSEPSPAPTADAIMEGLEPEDALATMLPEPPAPAGPSVLPEAALDQERPRAEEPPPPRAPAAAAEPSAPDAGPTANTEPPERASDPRPVPQPSSEPKTALAASALPRPPTPQPDAAPPPATHQPAPARRERPRPPARPLAPAAQATLRDPEPRRAEAPVPGPAAPEQAPLVRGLPRFRRPPPPPVYPAQAQERGDEGAVALRLLVGADGGTREIRVLRSSGNPLLDDAALAAARRWEIEPASLDGRPAEAWVEVPVRFRLER